MSTASVVVVGSTNMDVTIKVPRLPVVGETVLGGEWLVSPGGKGANQAVAARRAGAEVTFVSAVGDDEFGRRALGNLRDNGVSVRHVETLRDAQTGVAIIMVDERGRNMIAVSSGANGLLSPEDVDLAQDPISGAAVLLLQLEIPIETVARAIGIARAVGTMVLLNPAPASPLSERILSQVDVLIANEIEAAQLARPSGATQEADAPAALMESGVGSVVLTLGERGALVRTDGGETRVPAHPVHAVDTVGAGDTFCGAIACALAEGRDIVAAARFAKVAAALATTEVGAQSAIPTRDRIEAAERY